MKKYLFITLLFFSVHLSFSKCNVVEDFKDFCSQSISLNGNDWKVAKDSANIGIKNLWFINPPIYNSQQIRVPWVIQDVFNDYHGIAWYWREFIVTEDVSTNEISMLKFHAVDYKAEVWLNGQKVGEHEGGELPFELDVSGTVKFGQKNLLIVRVLNPTYEAIDNITLKETPSSLKHHPFTSNAVYNSGGIVGDVELIKISTIRVLDMFVIPNWETGSVKIITTVMNMGKREMSGQTISFLIREARSGNPVIIKKIIEGLHPGINTIETNLHISYHKLWSPDNPFLYSVTTSIETLKCIEEKSTRFGFRDFRFNNGYYRLNGKRIFLIGTNSSTHYPISYSVPLNEDMLIRDVINMKALGQNFVRIPFGCPNPKLFDIFDEMGIMVHQEHYGSWQMGEYGGYEYEQSENANEALLLRFEKSITGVIKRDRNHPSIVMWGALNENKGDMVFHKTVELLPKLRTLDPTRIIVLNSGRFDGNLEIGSMSNPNSTIWDISESQLKDWHPYVGIPYSKETLDQLSGRLKPNSSQSIYISESGLCFPIDLPTELGDYQLRGKANSDDARYFKRQYEKFLTDWQRFSLNELWPRPEDYIRDAYKTANSIREIGESAIRANPSLVAYTPTNGVADYSMGESVATNFRRLKPELIPSVLLANNPLRWCLATEPQSIYNNGEIQINVSFSNFDVLSPGSYPAKIQIINPDNKLVYEKKVSIDISETINGVEPPFAQQVFVDNIKIDGKAGKYEMLATLEEGGTAVGGKIDFYVSSREDKPIVQKEIVLVGEDTKVSNWMKKHQIKVLSLNEISNQKRQLIVIVGPDGQNIATMKNIAERMAKGNAVIFLSPFSLMKNNNPTGWLPLTNKGRMEPMDLVAGYYRADRWVKDHPIFEGMPSGGMMDYKYFRNIISLNAISQEYTIRAKPAHTFKEVSSKLDYPTETVSGATRISHNYCSGIQLGIWDFGEGKFIVNTLNIIENLNSDPAADLLLHNLINFASKDFDRPLTKGLPQNFSQKLKEIGYLE